MDTRMRTGAFTALALAGCEWVVLIITVPEFRRWPTGGGAA